MINGQNLKINKMTKKFIESYLVSNHKKTQKREFVIPDVLNFTNNFIGIETKKEYSFGMICYTGVDLDSKIITDRLIKNQLIKSYDKNINKFIDSYLIDLKQYKISNKVTISYENGKFELKLSDIKKNENISRS